MAEAPAGFGGLLRQLRREARLTQEELAEAAGLSVRGGLPLRNLGVVRRVTGEYPAAARILEQALGIYRDLGNRLGQGQRPPRTGGRAARDG